MSSANGQDREGKVVLVTGASSGIGQAIASELAARRLARLRHEPQRRGGPDTGGRDDRARCR